MLSLGCRTCSGHLWLALQTGKGEVRDGWAGAGAQEGAEVLDAVQRGCVASTPCLSRGIQDQTQQGSGPDMALLAGYFTTAFAPKMFSNTSVFHDGIYCKDEL